MAKLIYSALASLDGYVADEDGNVRLGRAGRGRAHLPQRPRRGRSGPTSRDAGCTTCSSPGRRIDLAGQPAYIRDFAEIWRATDKIVYSRTLETPASARTRIERDFDPDAVRS